MMSLKHHCVQDKFLQKRLSLRRSFYYLKSRIMFTRKRTGMKTLKNISLLFICNFVGFFLPTFLYLISLSTRIIDVQSEDFDAQKFFYGTTNFGGTENIPVPYMVTMPQMTWVLCFLFSFSIFFVSKKWKRVFLLAPLLTPFLHSFLIML